MQEAENRLLWGLKIATVAIVVIFWLALQSSQDFWPLTRWRMYATGVYPPATQDGYQLLVTAVDGTEYRLYAGDLFGWEEMALDEADLIGRALTEPDVYLREDYRRFVMDRLQRALPDVDVAWIEIWHMTWPVRRWQTPSIDRDHPLGSSLELRLPGDYYLLTQPQETEVYLEFGGSLGLLDHRLLNDPAQIAACDTLFVYSGWRALQQPADDYQITLVLVGLDGMGIAQDDGPLAISRTGGWQVGDEHLDRRSITLPCDLTPGIYRLMIALYDLQTVQNLPISYPGGPAFTTLAIVAEINVTEAAS